MVIFIEDDVCPVGKAEPLPEEAVGRCDLAMRPEIAQQPGAFNPQRFCPGVFTRYGIDAEAQGDGIEAGESILIGLQRLHLIRADARPCQGGKREGHLLSLETRQLKFLIVLVLELYWL